MGVIRPICRAQFTAEDIDFVLSVLNRPGDDRRVLVDLLTDPESRDLILDNKHILYAILEGVGCLSISSRLYFYILVRHALMEARIDNRETTDYLAEMLTVFLNPGKEHNPLLPSHNTPILYVTDLLAGLQNATPKQRFLIRVHLGNVALFLLGLFPQFIRWRRQRRGAPSVDYYEQVGRSSYHAASAHRLAETYELTSVYNHLSHRFHDTCLALNDLSNRLLTLENSRFNEEMLVDPHCT